MNQTVEIKGVELTELADNNQCKFPVHTEDRHHLFCGLPSKGSWCPAHEKLVMVPVPPRRGRITKFYR